jgi:hypothetical protein
VPRATLLLLSLEDRQKKKFKTEFNSFVSVGDMQSMPPDNLVSASGHTLLVVAGRLVVGVDDGVGGHTVGVVRLSPCVDGVDVGDDGALGSFSEESKHVLPCEIRWLDKIHRATD